MGKPKKDGKAYVSHKAGSLYKQNPAGTATLQFTYKIGDPEYFEFVKDEIVKNDIFIPSKG